MFNVITFTETWAEDNLVNLLQIANYNSEFKHKINRKEGGGLAIYIQDTINYRIRTDISFPSEKQSEYDSLIIELVSHDPNHSNTIIANIYRSPNFNNIPQFTSHLKHIVETIARENKNIIITGDFNIDLLKTNTHIPTAGFLDMMISNGMIPQITLPTRLTHSTASLIDHIFTNSPNETSIAGTITTDISDHFSNFILIKLKIPKRQFPTYITYRRYDETSFAKFNSELENVDFSSVYINDPSQAYSSFLDIILSLRNKHMPEIRKRFNRYKHKINPWITKGILKSLRTKDKI
jgi:hypothetical protein